MKIANQIITVVAGLVLIVAAALKIHQLLTEPIISKGFLESWEFFLIQIPLELGLGIWLVCGLFRKAAWMVAVLAFGLFIAVTLQKGLIGAESCGCFGRVKVNPWITLSAIDIPLFLGLVIFRPRGLKLLPPPWPSAKHFFGVAIPTFIVIGVIIPVLILYKPPDKTDKYEVVKPNEWIRKENLGEKQIGEEWSMLKHIDIADSLRSNIAVVVFYNTGCDACQDAIPLYDQMSRDMAGNRDSIRFAFIEIPPYASGKDSIVPVDTLCLRGRLDSSKEWYIQTPLVVVIRDGLVVKSWEAETPQLDEILDAVQETGGFILEK
ncbi:MAG: MauE/DoxX family redox-associated membrane protein [Sedimentisphaerales bacterium]